MITVTCDYCGKPITDSHDQVNVDIHSFSPHYDVPEFQYHRKCFEHILAELLKKSPEVNK